MRAATIHDLPVGRSVELPINVANPGANVIELEVAPGPKKSGSALKWSSMRARRGSRP